MRNNIEESNPYGSVETKEIDEFETRMAINLPVGYKEYLKKHNGGKPLKLCFRTKSNPNEFLDIEDFFTIKVGVPEKTIDNRGDVSKTFDLVSYKDQLSRYLLIGYATGGTGIVLDLQSGAVLFYEPDHEEPKHDEFIPDRFEMIAASFDEFIASLISEDEADKLEEEWQ